jgi:hypothetical protein
MVNTITRWLLASAVVAAAAMPALSWAGTTLNHNETLVRE